jgi:hypothetical protein
VTTWLSLLLLLLLPEGHQTRVDGRSQFRQDQSCTHGKPQQQRQQQEDEDGDEEEYEEEDEEDQDPKGVDRGAG